MAGAALTLVRPPRDLRLDVLRGWMQVSIFISHAAGTMLFWGIHAAWGLSDSSEQFVLLSGLVLGSVFTLKHARDGFPAAWRDLRHRTIRLWRIHLTVFVLFGLTVLWAERVVGLPGEITRLGWAWFAEAPTLAIPGGAALVYQPHFMGTFPVFLCCMAVLPGFLWLVGRFGARALAGSVGLYLFSQVTGPLIPGIGGTEIAFDPLAWQVLFMIGAYVGRVTLLGEGALSRNPALVAGAICVVVFGFWVRLIGHDIIDGPELEPLLLLGKEHLALPRLLHALSLAYLVALVVPRSARWMESVPAQAMAAIGRNSLLVFSFGLFLSYLYTVVARVWPGCASYLDVPMIAVGTLILVVFAWRLERKRGPAVAARRAA